MEGVPEKSMQGNLNEIDICSILQLIELGQRTGLLYIEADLEPNSRQRLINLRQYRLLINTPRQISHLSWLIFCDRGEIIYATDFHGSVNSSHSRLDDYLRHYRVKLPSPITQSASTCQDDFPFTTPEYENLWMLLNQDIINTNQARTILTGLIRETIFELLDIRGGKFVFQEGIKLTPKLDAWEITPLIQEMNQQLRNWQLLFPHIQSPQQLPQLRNPERVRASLPANTVQKLQRWADGKTSLRRLSRMLHRDILVVGKAIYPYVQQGFVQLLPPSSDQLSANFPSHHDQPSRRVLCLGEPIPESLQSILLAKGYQAIAIPNSSDSLLRLFDIQPNFILLHVSVCDDKIYDLCGMLRYSQTFKFVPIIILCPEDGYINRVRAQISGATDFLSIPCQDSELIMLIEKHLNHHVHNHIQQNQHLSIAVNIK